MRWFALAGLLAFLIPSQAFAVTFLEYTDLFEDADTIFTDVEIPTKPHANDYDSDEDYQSDMEDYYESLGTLILTHPLWNGAPERLEGYSAEDGTRYYSPAKTLNRAEAAKFFRVFVPRFNSYGTTYDGVESCFSDLNSSDWYYDHACVLKEAGVIKGYSDGTYKGANTLNYAEIAKFIMKAYELDTLLGMTVDESAYTNWYDGYFDVVEQLNIMPEGLDPSGNPTRGEMAGYIMRAYVVSTMATGEAFDDYELVLFMEEFMGWSGVDPLQGYLFNPSDTFYAYTLNVESTNESVTFVNAGEESLDIGGYYVRLWDTQGLGSYQASQVEYTFPEGTTVEASGTVTVYTVEGDHLIEGGDRQGDGGLIDSVWGSYAWALYNTDHELIDIVGFDIP